jgi:hypothetical protein
MSDSGLPELYGLFKGLTNEEAFELLQQTATKTGVVINIVNINKVEHIHVSEASMDHNKKTESNITVGNITGSAIGAIGTARDINVFAALVDSSSTMNQELKNELKIARAELEKASLPPEDKGDVAQNLDNLTDELNKPEAERNPSRVRRFLERIKDVAPPIASILSIAASIARLATG